MDNKQHEIDKFKRYEADFRQYLLEKYFSGKTIDGEDIYDLEVNLDGKTTKASSKPPYQSYLDDKVFDVLKNEGPGPSNGLVSEVLKKQGPRFSYDLVAKALQMQEEPEPSEETQTLGQRQAVSEAVQTAGPSTRIWKGKGKAN